MHARIRPTKWQTSCAKSPQSLNQDTTTQTELTFATTARREVSIASYYTFNALMCLSFVWIWSKLLWEQSWPQLIADRSVKQLSRSTKPQSEPHTKSWSFDVLIECYSVMSFGNQTWVRRKNCIIMVTRDEKSFERHNYNENILMNGLNE